MYSINNFIVCVYFLNVNWLNGVKIAEVRIDGY